jgi:hypothetical protein
MFLLLWGFAGGLPVIYIALDLCLDENNLLYEWLSNWLSLTNNL